MEIGYLAPLPPERGFKREVTSYDLLTDKIFMCSVLTKDNLSFFATSVKHVLVIGLKNIRKKGYMKTFS